MVIVTRGRRWPWLLGAGLVIVAVVAVLVYRRYHDDVRPVTIDQAIDDYDQSTAAPATAATVASEAPAPSSTSLATIELPTPGVYRYAATGHEGVDALGGVQHDYPAETAVVVTPEGCGVRVSWTPFEERTEGWDVCLRDGGIAIVGYTSTHEFFGTPDVKHLSCPDAWLLAPATEVDATSTCNGDGLTEQRTTTVIGPTTVMIDGVEVDAIDLTVAVVTSGSTNGSTTRHLVLHARTGIPLQWTDTVGNTTSTAIGDVHYTETFTLTATSLTPAT